MAKPQQPELHRSSKSPADPASTKSQPPTSPVATDAPGPVPEDNRPGHHPEHEQDKPVEEFVARASRPRRAAGAGNRAGSAEHGQQSPGAGSTRRRSGREGGGASPLPQPHQEAPEPGQNPPQTGVTGGGFSVGAIVPALAFADAARRPDGAWEEIGESKARWLAQIALVPVLGSWRYMTSVKPRLEAAERAWTLAGG